ncbi:MATE family efflux transporter [Acidilutibacter cellobiosedens]|jgi:putative MATE family efflux protein|uniref:MATE family efflux transporter n=1 Tax=Acidilutibacter cellobiosedens TaxID=2507161 RepID=A0A410Q8Q9_9FIRM|nr:MATE family efflux transporter [Acidilutibacter cellobiosedens]QAT60375.1 MATE family efflux transporter [Acidilutibacter cellobiosedens]
MKHDTVNKYNLAEGVIWQQILIFFFPILFGTFFQQLYNTVDAIVVGRFVGKEALSAVGGTTGTLINLLVNFFVGISSGATVIISQYYGAKKREDLNTAVHTAIGMAVIGGAFIMVVGFLASPIALRAMNTPSDVIEYSIIYIRIYFTGMIANLIYNMGSGILRAVGDSKRPLYFLIVSCFVNIVLDLLFVIVFGWGVHGVAIATVLSQCVSAVLILLALSKTDESYQIQFNNIKIHGDKLDQIFKIGLPAGLQSVMYSIANMAIQVCINSFGTDTVAAWTAFSKIDGLFWMMMGAFGVSITTFVGQNYGAEKMDRVKKGVRQCLSMCMLSAVILSMVLYFAGQYIYLMFTADTAVIEKGMEILRFLVPTYFTFVFIEILSGALRGMGNSLVPMLITCLGVCGLRIVWIFCAVPIKPDIKTVVFSYPLSWIVTSVLFIFYYRHFVKKIKSQAAA